MRITDLIEFLEIAAENGTTDIEIHFQQNYPLKGGLANARILDGKVALAVAPGGEYGEKRAWLSADDPFDEDPRFCVTCGYDDPEFINWDDSCDRCEK